MIPILALAGLAGLSSEDEFWFTGAALLGMLLQALFLPIFTFDHPPQWMVVLQPPIVIAGLFAVHIWMRRVQPLLFRRVAFYFASYCLLLFSTNMAGEARGIFSLAGDLFVQARLITSGQGYPADTRP